MPFQHQTVVSVLQRIAEEKNWSPADTEQDFAVLAKHRLVYVRDLRALSGESWTVSDDVGFWLCESQVLTVACWIANRTTTFGEGSPAKLN